MKEDSYRVIRFFCNSGCRRIIKRNLSRELAREHCQNPETSSSTCKGKEGKRRTRRCGRWFDGFEKE